MIFVFESLELLFSILRRVSKIAKKVEIDARKPRPQFMVPCPCQPIKVSSWVIFADVIFWVDSLRFRKSFVSFGKVLKVRTKTDVTNAKIEQAKSNKEK